MKAATKRSAAGCHDFAPNIGGRSSTEGGWDTHGFDNTRMFPIIEKYHLPTTEQTLPTLLNDLDPPSFAAPL